MRDLLEQIREALRNPRLYYLALFASLALPDICGAINSEDGKANKWKYVKWYDQYVARTCPFLTGEDCYRFRCSLLHQGSTQHPKSSYARIVFVEPSATASVFHCNTEVVPEIWTGG